MKSCVLVVALPMLAMLLDFATGFVAAARNGIVSSSVMRTGMWNKLGEILAIIFGFLAQFSIEFFGKEILGVNPQLPIVYGVCGYIIIYEFVSIIENIGQMSPKIAKKLNEIIGIHPDKLNLKEGE
jgi:phage-related holin